MVDFVLDELEEVTFVIFKDDKFLDTISLVICSLLLGFIFFSYFTKFFSFESDKSS